MTTGPKVRTPTMTTRESVSFDAGLNHGRTALQMDTSRQCAGSRLKLTALPTLRSTSGSILASSNSSPTRISTSYASPMKIRDSTRPLTTFSPPALASRDPDEFRPDAQRGLAARGDVAPLAGDGPESAIHDGVVRFVGPHDGLDQVGAADEIRHEAVVRIEIDFLGVAHFDDPPVAHDRDGVRERQRLDPVVRHVDRGDLQLAQKGPQLLAGFLAELGVQVA